MAPGACNNHTWHSRHVCRSESHGHEESCHLARASNGQQHPPPQNPKDGELRALFVVRKRYLQQQVVVRGQNVFGRTQRRGPHAWKAWRVVGHAASQKPNRNVLESQRLQVPSTQCGDRYFIPARLIRDRDCVRVGFWCCFKYLVNISNACECQSGY